MILGNIIKYHRIARNFTQSQLCSGICSVTHLSKIENNNKEANPETIALLLSRLGLTLSDIEHLNQVIDNKLNEFLRHMIYFDKPAATGIYTSLKKEEEQIMLSENVYKYHLYVYRYYLLIGDLTKSLKKKRMLEQFSHVFSQHENHLFNYCNAILLLQQGSFTESLRILNSFEKEVPLPYALQGEFYYQIALTYSNLADSSSCVTYAQKAIKEFRSEYNYVRTLHAQVLLGIHYTELGLYEEANDQYSHLLRNVQIVSGEDLLATIHHNFAITCEKQLDYEQAAMHYEIAQEKAFTPQQYYLSLCNLTEIQIKTGKSEEALTNIHLILENTNTKSMRKYYLIFKYYKYVLLNKTNIAFNYLEKHVLPYLEKHNLVKETKKFSSLLADYHAETDKEKAIYYYKKSQR